MVVDDGSFEDLDDRTGEARLVEQHGGAISAESEEGRRRLRDMPLGRFGRADEVADSVIFLLSDASSLFLGQTLNPNAGGYMP